MVVIKISSKIFSADKVYLEEEGKERELSCLTEIWFENNNITAENSVIGKLTRHMIGDWSFSSFKQGRKIYSLKIVLKNEDTKITWIIKGVRFGWLERKLAADALVEETIHFIADGVEEYVVRHES